MGFTSMRDGEEWQVQLRRPEAEPYDGATSATPSRERVEGHLLHAYGKKQKPNYIEIVERGGRSHKVYVPEGLMADIVRPLWDEQVVVVARRDASRLVLEEIRSAAEQ